MKQVMMDLTVAVIGVAGMGRSHIDAAIKYGARIGAICDINEDALRYAGDKFAVPVERRFTDYNEIVRGGDIGNFFGMIDENELRSATLVLINDTASPSFDRISNFLQGKRFLSSLSSRTSEPFPELYIADISFPWQRTFEAEIRIEIKT